MINTDNNYDKSQFGTSQKLAQKTLIGIEKQLEVFANITKDAFSNFNGNFQSDWDSDLEQIKEKIQKLLKEFPAKAENQDLARLEEITKKSGEYTTHSLTDEEKDDSKKLEQWKEKAEYFKDGENSASRLLKTLSEKLDRLKNSIDTRNKIKDHKEDLISKSIECFVFRLKKLLPDIAILNELKYSLIKDERLEKKYNDLKTVWFKTLVSYKNIENKVNEWIVNLSIMPKLLNLKSDLKTQQECFETLKTNFDEISTQSLSLDLSDKTQAVKIYKKSLNDFIASYPKIVELKKRILDSHNVVLAQVREIERLRESIEKTTEENLNFLGDDMKEELKQQKAKAKERLNDLKSLIVNNWNEFYMQLIDTTHRINIFSSFKYPTEKMSSCLLILDSILKKKDKNTTTFVNTEKKLSMLCDWVNKKNDENKALKLLEIINEDPSLLLSSSRIVDSSSMPADTSEQQNNLETLDIFSKKIHQEDNLHAELIKVNEIDPLIVADSMTSLDQEKLSEADFLVFISDEHKTNVVKEFDAQKEKLAKELDKYKENTRKSFDETLANLCDQALVTLQQEKMKISTITHTDVKQPEPEKSLFASFSGRWTSPQPEKPQTPIETKPQLKNPFRK